MTRLSWIAAAAFAAGAVAQTTEITITIVASNAGGNSETMQMNAPMMQPGTVHQVTVGGEGGLIYNPETISAAVGDMVQFNFMSQNHTVTQSTFAQPCVKMANGANSGFMPNPNNTLSPPPMMMFQVMTQDPIWMYCAQKGHCGKGMVFSINPTAEKSQQAFKTAAAQQNGTAGAAPPAAAPPPAAAAGNATTGVVPGTASNANGQCSCSCLCGSSAFPNANQGLGMLGGMAGSIPASAAGSASGPPAKRDTIPLIA